MSNGRLVGREAIESIAAHAHAMWSGRHLPGVPPRRVDEDGLEVDEEEEEFDDEDDDDED